MNISSYHPLPINSIIIPPVVERLGHEFIRGAAFLLIPVELLYFSIYFHSKGYLQVYKILTLLSLCAFWSSSYIAPISCGPAQCLQNFAIAIGTMKVLDIWARRNGMPKYTAGKQPPNWYLAWIVMTELRYESFTPNHVRVSKDEEDFSEPTQLIIHLGLFAFLQSMPQNIPTVLAFEVQLAIYILWTSMQLLLRYKSSPSLFGPLYKADSLTGFWSETWHNAFASPCTSLAYSPLRNGLPKLGVPKVIARALGVLAAFTLMAVFHMYALHPILDHGALIRIGLFFVLNGVGTVLEAALWGHRKHWTKSVMAWAFQTTLASWTAAGLNIPNGLSRIRWNEVCEAPIYY